MGAPLLIALDPPGEPARVALERAIVLGAAARAPLHLLRVVPTALPTPIEQFEAERELRRDLRDLLPASLGRERVKVSGGDVVREVCASVSRLRAGLVVLGDSPDAARRAASIAVRARVSVLVARAAWPAGSVLGTTALVHRRYPVLRKARQLATWLEAPLFVLHNLAPRAGAAHPSTEQAAAEEVFAITSCSAHLSSVARDVAPGAAVVVGQHGDAVEAILDGERRYASDVLVVGARVGHPPGQGPSIAEVVARQARASVLVTPME
ncbi:MAG: universal stress protein [Myxococcaceae bacterium]|nr:universal stress protein [Myxococcaceae bacterium]